MSPLPHINVAADREQKNSDAVVRVFLTGATRDNGVASARHVATAMPLAQHVAIGIYLAEAATGTGATAVFWKL